MERTPAERAFLDSLYEEADHARVDLRAEGETATLTRGREICYTIESGITRHDAALNTRSWEAGQNGTLTASVVVDVALQHLCPDAHIQAWLNMPE
jgi:hypothetical protein